MMINVERIAARSSLLLQMDGTSSFTHQPCSSNGGATS